MGLSTKATQINTEESGRDNRKKLRPNQKLATKRGLNSVTWARFKDQSGPHIRLKTPLSSATTTWESCQMSQSLQMRDTWQRIMKMEGDNSCCDIFTFTKTLTQFKWWRRGLCHNMYRYLDMKWPLWGYAFFCHIAQPNVLTHWVNANVSLLVAAGVLAGPVRTTPEDPGPVEEAADSNPRWGADPVEEEAAAGWQWGSSWGGTGCPPVLVHDGNVY